MYLNQTANNKEIYPTKNSGKPSYKIQIHLVQKIADSPVCAEQGVAKMPHQMALVAGMLRGHFFYSS